MSAVSRCLALSLFLVVLALPAFGAAGAAANALTRAETIEDARLTTAGLGGMRNFGDGTIALTGVQGSVRKALLFWHGPTNNADPLVNATVTFAGTPVTGQQIGFSGDNFWGYQNSQAYRADVTALVTGDGNYALSNFIKGAPASAGSANVNGVSLIVFSEPSAPGMGRDFVLAQGNDSNQSSTFDGPAASFTVPNVQYSYAGGSAALVLTVSDGQNFNDEGLNVNGTQLLADGPNYNGATVPVRPGGSSGTTNGGLWDIRRVPGLEAVLTPGPNTLTVQTRPSVSDALAYVLAIVELPVYSFAPSLSVANATASETNPDGRLRFTVTLSETVETDTTFNYTTADGTATSPADYTPTTGTGTIPAGQTTTTIDVPIANDAPDEADETFTLTISNAQPQGTQITVPTATGTITDPVPAVSYGTAPTQSEESGQDLRFTLNLSEASTRDLTVKVSTENGSAIAPGDYTALNAVNVVFPAGTTEKTVDVDVVDDALIEGPETLQLAATIGTNAAVRQTGTITSGDRDTKFSVSDATRLEDDATLDFTISIDAAAPEPVTVQYATSSGSASEPSDFTATAGTATVPAGETSVVVSVPISEDTLYENDETLTLTLSNPTGARIVDGTGAGVIENDDAAPVVSFGTAPSVSEESPDDLVFTLKLAEAADRTVAVSVSTEYGTAVSPGDYTAATDTVVFPAGSTEQTFTVGVIDDGLLEASESMKLVATPANGEAISQTGTITSADKAVLTVADVVVSEADGTALVTFTADQPVPDAFDFGVRTVDGTATSGSDFTGGDTYTANFNGTDTATVSIPISEDGVDELDETFTVQALDTGDAFTGDTEASVTITDNDVPKASISDATGAEGGSLSFTVSLDGPAAQASSVRVTTTSGTAVEDEDFTAVDQVVEFAVGETSKTVTVPLTTDALQEDDEDFLATLDQPTGGIAVDDAEGSGTISANGAPEVSVSSPEAPEGDALDFVVSLSAPAQRSLTVNYETADGTATSPEDYESLTGSVTFAVGEQEKTVSVTVAEDAIVEDDETFGLKATLAGSVNTATGTGTITDDDGAAVSVDAPSVEEGHDGTAPATVTVRLADPAARDVAYSYSTADGTAKDGSDYETVSGTRVIEAGDTSDTFTIPVIGDTTYEVRRETVEITIAAPTRNTARRADAALAPDVFTSGTLTILDEDALDAPVIVTGPPESSTEKTAAFTLSGRQAGAAYECSLDLAGTAPTFGACPDPLTYSALPVGSYVLSVRQVADTGRTSPVATRSFRVTSPPAAVPKVTPFAAACESAPGIRSVGAVARSGGRVRFELARRLDLPVRVDVFSVSKGSAVIKERLVARFENRRAAFLWNGRGLNGTRVPDGTYLVRYRMSDGTRQIDTRRIVLSRNAGVFSRRGDSHRRDQCLLLTRFKLERPVFGGSGAVPLRIAYVLSRPGSVTVEVLRGSRVVKRFEAVERAAGQTFRIALPSAGLARGTYRVRVRATRPGAASNVASLYAKKL